MINGNDILAASLALMDESTAEGYENRAVALLNTLIGRCYGVSAETHSPIPNNWKSITSLEDEIEGIDKTLCLAAMPYGLAALLYLEEDPVRSRSWWSIFLEQLELCRRTPRSFEPISNLYGGMEHSCYGSW